MAAVTHAGTTWTTAAGNKTVTATPAVNDLIVVVAATSGLAGGTTAVTDDNSSGTYTQVDTDRTGFSTTGVLTVWVRDSLITSAVSTIFTASQGSSTGGGLTVYRVSGMTKTGASAVRGSGGQSTGGAGTTPAPVLSQTPTGFNPVIGAVANGTSPAGLTPPSGFTENASADVGYATPTTGLESATDDSGQTSATVTWGSTSASAFASVAIELTTEGTTEPYQLDPRNYRANIFFRPSGEAFQTLGDATSPTGETPITLTDTGAGDDAITVAADVPLSDAGSAADSISVDTGIGTDPNQAWPQFEPHLIRPGAQPFQTLGDSTATSPAVPITLDDAGTATDALSVFVESDQNQAGPQFATMFLEPSAAALQLFGDATTNAPTPITLLDVGGGADSLTVAAAVPLDDAGAASDALTVSAAVPLADAGAGSDALTVSAAVPLTDTGAGSDAVTIAADVPLTDAAVGTDSISVQVLGEPDPYQAAPLPFPSFATPFAEPQAKPLQLQGDASGVAQISLTDTGTGDDTLSVSATLPLSDAAAGADALSVAAAVPLSDTATGTDGVALIAAGPLADAATGDDALSVLVSIVTDANQAIPKQFGWSYLQPGWVVPFQFLGSREAAPGLVNATSTPTVTAGRGSTATVTSATTSAPAVSAAATSIPSVSDG